MTLLRASLAFALLSGTTGLIAVPGDSKPQLLLQGDLVNVDSIADLSHGFLKWSHGALLYVDARSHSAPSFYTLDREGRLISSTTLNIPDATLISTGDFDRAPDGTIIFTGESYSSDGRGTPFIAWISPTGQTERVIRTDPYHPYTVAVALDGTVWTMGCEMINHDVRAPGLNPDASVLRHFDQQGRLIGSGGPQSQFKTQTQISRLVHGYLAATRDRVGWYSLIDGPGRYVEISTSTMQTTIYPGFAPVSGGRVTSLALTDAGQAYIESWDPVSHTRITYRLNRGTSQWVPVQAPPFAEARFGPSLMGNDGEQLVFYNAHKAGFFSPAN